MDPRQRMDRDSSVQLARVVPRRRAIRWRTSARSPACCSRSCWSAASICTSVFDTSVGGAWAFDRHPVARSSLSRRLAAQPASLCRRRLPAGHLAASAARMGARALHALPARHLADRRAAAAVPVHQRHRRLLVELGPARSVLGDRRAPSCIDALPLLAAPLTRNFVEHRRGQRPPVLAADLRPPRRAAAAAVRPLVPPAAHHAVPQVWPPRALSAGRRRHAGAAGAGDAGAQPGAGGPRRRRRRRSHYDWILLHLHPLAEACVAGARVGADRRRPCCRCCCCRCARGAAPVPVAVVDAGNCNGCRRCVDDCPYSAITLEPHPNGQPRPPDRGGGRPTAAPVAASASAPVRRRRRFAARDALVTGIDMPQ